MPAKRERERERERACNVASKAHRLEYLPGGVELSRRGVVWAVRRLRPGLVGDCFPPDVMPARNCLCTS